MPLTDYDFATILDDGADKVVVATYAQMRDRIAELHDSVVASAAAPADQGLLDAAAADWREARGPWERSEAFLFGPAAFLSLDPALDSWPVDRQQLQDVLDSSFELTPEFVADGLLRGYHTIEYLMFRDGAPRSVGDVTVPGIRVPGSSHGGTARRRHDTLGSLGRGSGWRPGLRRRVRRRRQVGQPLRESARGRARDGRGHDRHL